MASEEAKPAEAVGVEMPLAFQYPSGPALFANNFAIQFDGDEFHLSFFEIQPPMLMGTAEEKKAAAEKIGTLTARAVARIVISKGRMGTIAKLIYDNAKKHLGEDALK